MKILVTGGAGIIGQALCKKMLATGWRGRCGVQRSEIRSQRSEVSGQTAESG